MDETLPDLAIVSMHEKGFPQADLYLGFGSTPAHEFERIAPSPDSFFSLKRGDTLGQAAAAAKARWPTAMVVPAADDETDDEEQDD